jgi:DNA-binding transcriptional ArsR family regulator
MSWTNRLPVAALIAILTGGMLGGIVGFASADGATTESFHVPEPAIGDQWSYDVKSRSGGNGGATTGSYIEHYEYLDGQAWHDGEGKQYPVIPLRTTWEIDGREPATFLLYVDQQTHDIRGLQAHNLTAWVSRASGTAVGGIALRSMSETEALVEATSYENTPPFCGHTSPLQSPVPVSLEAPFLIPTSCLFGGGDGLLQEYFEVHALGKGTLDGLETLLLRADGEFGSIRMWMHNATPYPVRTEVNLSWTLDLSVFAMADDEPTSVTFYLDTVSQLTHFSPGGADWKALIEVPADIPVQDIELAPITLWGPDDSGVALPFLPSEAFAGARDDVSFLGLRNYLADHPNAANLQVEYLTARDADTGATERSWEFLLYDDQDAYIFTATQTDWNTALPPTVEYNEGDAFLAQMIVRFIIGIDHLPALMPTAASAMQRADDLLGIEANMWTTKFACFLECYWGVEVGEMDRVDQQDIVNGNSFQGSRSSIYVDETGTVKGTGIWQTRGTTSRGAVAEPVVSISPHAEPTQSGPLQSAFWQVPSAPVATSLGILGLLAGLLYWAWPALKAAPLFGMFSRVRGPALLDHPVRNDIMVALRAQPGMHYQAIVSEVGKGRGVVEHHLRKLETSDLVTATRGTGFTCYFPKGQVDRHVMAGLPAIKSATAASILDATVQQPGITAQQLVARFGVTASTVSHHLRRLSDAGFVEVARGRTKAIIPTRHAAPALALRRT